MMLTGILILCLWLLVIPTAIGTIFTGVDKQAKKPPFLWISGQVCLWAGFQLICVPLVLLQKDYIYVVRLFGLYAAGMLMLAAVLYFVRRKKTAIHLVTEAGQRKRSEYIVWIIFAGLLLFQLVQAVRMTYADGDDAYYVAMTSVTENANTMYRKLPYTGGTTELDARHGLAPFPVWIAFLADVSGVRPVSAAHVAVPVALIAMTYGIFYLLGDRIFAKKRESVPVFLVFTELLVLFGDYSFYTAENFMIARSRQGKAALGNIIIPLLLLLLLHLMERVQEQERIAVGYWILLAGVMTAGCLCSTLGALLACMLVGITGLCGAFCYRKWKLLPPLLLSCMPCVGFAVLYLLL